PQYLLEQGLRVLVTQPRRLACSTVAERVAQEWGCQLGGTVGYRTARDRQDGPETACLFATEGLALIREIMGARRAYDVLVLDEVHEWSLDM
ncbi:DEAD/DEAH box helicase family protein, partial [Streptococcus pneumoniae]|uniref:DEAD/DEAH box helicase family protein n=1 Tax=Streptococcus pneumoniae TaxID=1313 RepID=UPI0018B08C36